MPYDERMTRRDSYLEPYRRSQKEHGSAFEVTLWASPASQRRRFDVFTQSCSLAGKRVLDAGCSRGDFCEYLVERKIAYEKYVGIDGLPEVVEFARTRRLPRAEFHAGDLLHDASLFKVGLPQVVVVSGTLNTMQDADVIHFLESAWASGVETLMFNFLSDLCGPQAPPQDDFARRLSAVMLLQWAASRTWSVVLRQDYFRNGHDATIIMQRTP